MGLYVYNGSSWSSQATGLKLYNGSTWVNATRGYVYNGSSWSQFYPEAPGNTASPTFSYSTAGGFTWGVGQTISVTTGTWTNNPTSYSYQWYKMPNGGSWSVVSGATSSSWYMDGTVAGCQIKCAVTATNARGSTTVEVNPASGSFITPQRLTGLTSSKTGSGTVFASWSSAVGADLYYVQYSPNFTETSTTGTSITISGLPGPSVGIYVSANTKSNGWSFLTYGLSGSGASTSVSGLP
jgi:hypothetical protein